MKTNKQMAKEFCTQYKELRELEKATQPAWVKLCDMWENTGFADDTLFEKVEAAEKEFKKKEIETNICARLALDYILKDQENGGN